MKKIISSLCLLVVCTAAMAQKYRPQAVGYLKGEIMYYKVTNCQPSGPVEVYNQVDGGRLIAETRADDNGNALVEVPLSERPVLLVSRKEPPKEGVQSIGYTTLLERPEVELRSFNVEAGSTNQLKWEVISHRPGVNFDVYRSNANGAFEKIATLNAAQQPGSIFTYTDEAPPQAGGALYEVRVNNATGKLHLTMGAQQATAVKSNGIKVFPSLCTDHFTVQLPSGISGTVQVVSSTGMLVHSSRIQGGSTSISTTKLAAASYAVKVLGADNRVLYQGRITKQ